ncbi:hypothetical protein J6590_086687 [Homalodisca vitripennis]|nr:hypothetical protein J6590_086687 [Homalodisca vitripennis]
MRWYHKVAEEFLLGTAVVNAWLAYKDAAGVNSQSKNKHLYSITTFREKIVYAQTTTLVVGCFFCGLQNGQLEPVKKVGHHHLSETAIFVGEGKNKRRARKNCKICYARASRTGDQKATKNLKKITTFCEKYRFTSRDKLCRPDRVGVVANVLTHSVRAARIRAAPVPRQGRLARNRAAMRPRTNHFSASLACVVSGRIVLRSVVVSHITSLVRWFVPGAWHGFGTVLIASSVLNIRRRLACYNSDDPLSDDDSTDNTDIDSSDAEDDFDFDPAAWSNVSAAGMRDIPYTGDNKLLIPVPGNNEPIDWFNFFIDLVFLENICRFTNDYALEVFFGPTIMPGSRIHRWKPLTVPELDGLMPN